MDIRIKEWGVDGAVSERSFSVEAARQVKDAEAELFALGASRTGARKPVDNTNDFWCLTRADVPAGQWPVGVVWIREITEPWRRGFGLRIRSHAYCIWRKGPGPREIEGEPELGEDFAITLPSTPPGDLL